MASNGNFCTWTPLLGIKNDGDSGITLSNGNTTATQTHNGIATTGTLGVSSGKWYWEIYYSASADFNDGHLLAGWQSLKKNVEYAYTKQQPGGGLGAPDRFTWGSHLMNYRGGGTGAFGGGYLSSINNVNGTYSGAFNLGLRVGSASTLQYALDLDDYKMYFGVNNTWYDLAAGANTTSDTDITQVTGWSIESTWQGYQWIPACWFSGAGSGTVATINAGQDSTFSGRLTAGGNADDNGFGDFRYAPPSGFLALSSSNLPISEDIDPAQTDDDYPSKQFGVVTYTGNSTTGQTISGLNFKPDLLWAKSRASQLHFLCDSTRGLTKFVRSNDTNAESTLANVYTAFNDDGFVLGTSGSGPNDNGTNYVAWAWKANGGTATATIIESGNNPGAVVQANTKSKFSIITYTGTGGAGTIAHGLGAAPSFMLIKNREQTDSWAVYHDGNTDAPETNYLKLDTTAATADDATYWNDTAPTSSLLTIGTNHSVNADGETYVAYVWADLEGMQKFGSYEGNGDTNGPFVYLGFKPRLLAIKSIDSTQNWIVVDTARETFNPLGEKTLAWNDTGGDTDTAALNLDVASQGFKLRGNDAKINASETYIYMAWSDVPFKYNNTF